jgi:Elongation factor P, C-terminal/Elongation factor P (EF-P) OB domain
MRGGKWVVCQHNAIPQPTPSFPPKQQTYEETRVKRDDSWAKYLKEGTDVQLVTWNGKVISVDPPTTVELEVVDTDPGVKGNTVSGGSKPATLETGAVVQVPLFVNQGERVKIDTRTDEYLGRSQG